MQYLFDYNIWPNQVKETRRKPYLKEAAEEIEDSEEQDPVELRKQIESILSQQGVKNPRVIINSSSSNSVKINLQEQRDKNEIIRKYQDGE